MTAQPMTTTSTDRLEKRFHIDAPQSRVWRAISDAREFGTWFGMEFDSGFTAGRTIVGRITVPGFEHVKGEMAVVAIEPEHYFAYRWHPYAIDRAVDYSAEPMTLVEFRLAEADGGTEVTIVESGFDQLPASRRAEAFRMNEGGWASQSRKLTAHVGRT